MTAAQWDETLNVLMSQRPFKPFTIELNTGQRLEIDDPIVAAFKEGAGVLLAPGGVPVFFDHGGVNRDHQCPGPFAPGKRRANKGSIPGSVHGGSGTNASKRRTAMHHYISECETGNLV